MTNDPFHHHPELRELITPLEESFFANFSLEKLEALGREHDLETGWWYSDEVREAKRAAFFEGRPKGDLWVFGYGSLMWDPAFEFAEIRRAEAPGYARRFLLREDHGGRGDKEKPGLMAALDACELSQCSGLAFRIDAGDVETASDALWRREVIAPGYIPSMINVAIDGNSMTALTFVADHDADEIETDITRPQQVQRLATAAGILGSSRQYLENVVRHLHKMGIPDPEMDALLADVVVAAV